MGKSTQMKIFLFLFLSLTSFAFAQDPLEALLLKAQKLQTIQPDHALVQFSIFFEQKQDEKKLAEQLSMLVNAQAQSFISEYQQLKPKKTLVPQELLKNTKLSYAIVDQNLPINLEALIQSSGDFQEVLKKAQSVSFVKYQGRKLKQQQQIKWICQLTQSISAQFAPNAVIVNLSTFEALNLNQLMERCQNLNQGWYKPAIEMRDDQKVKLFSRGLSQFARPDLESDALSKDQASQSFIAFQKDLSWLRFNKFKAKKSKELNGKIVSPCERDPLYYDHQCVLVHYGKSE
jgi:hypothetical protein